MRRRLVLASAAIALCVGVAVAFAATPLKPPATLTAAPGDERATLPWPASASPGVTGYRVYRRGANGRWPATALTSTTARTFTDTGFNQGTAYTYRVTTIAGTRESKPSPTATATPAVAAAGGPC